MSTEEKESLKIEITDGVTVNVTRANKALVKSIWAATVVVAGFLYHGFNKVAGAYADVQKIKQDQATVKSAQENARQEQANVKETVQWHTTQLAVINNTLGIKQ